MAERRLRFRKSQAPPAPAKEPEAVVPPELIVQYEGREVGRLNGDSITDGLLGNLTRLLGDRRIAQDLINIASEELERSAEVHRTRHPDPNQQNIPRNLSSTGVSTAWHIPNPDYDFVDIYDRAGNPIISGLTMREAQQIVDAHNRADARARQDASEAAERIARAIRPAPQPTSVTARRPGTAQDVNISVDNIYRDVSFLGGGTQRIVTGPADINIRIQGSGDPSSILEDAIRLINDHSDQVRYDVTR